MVEARSLLNYEVNVCQELVPKIMITIEDGEMGLKHKAGIVLIPLVEEPEALAPIGLVGVRRKNKSTYGGLCFPGGYGNRGECVEAAVRRETAEETGLVLQGELKLRHRYRVEERGGIDVLCFEAKDRWTLNYFNKARPCAIEVLELVILTPEARLCFEGQDRCHGEWWRSVGVSA